MQKLVYCLYFKQNEKYLLNFQYIVRDSICVIRLSSCYY
jgi:hypothetical protein